MAGQQVRAQVRALVEGSGYRWLGPAEPETFERAEGGHRVTLLAHPRWGRRVEILTVDSAVPLANGEWATAFRLDLSSQLRPDGACVPARWGPDELAAHVDSVVVPYLRAVRGAGDILDLLLERRVRPPGSAEVSAVVRHGYYLAKWWSLTDRLEDLRDLAATLTSAERVQIQHAPWGRTEIAEVLWFGRDLPAPPARVPWGFADHGDPQAERWFRRPTRRSHEVVSPVEYPATTSRSV